LENERLEAECRRLRQAVASHATIDQAIGAAVALKGIPPEETWRALRKVSQGTNTKLHTVGSATVTATLTATATDGNGTRQPSMGLGKYRRPAHQGVPASSKRPVAQRERQPCPSAGKARPARARPP
jgi:hypothetical protein